MSHFRTRLGLDRQQVMFDALGTAQMSIPQLMAVTGLLRASAVLCMDRLCDKKMVYVAGFDPAVRSGWRRPIYAQGSLPDARPPGEPQESVPLVQQHWYSGLGL